MKLRAPLLSLLVAADAGGCCRRSASAIATRHHSHEFHSIQAKLAYLNRMQQRPIPIQTG